jgi:predicted patatin/cPLA2 family phospholipase
METKGSEKMSETWEQRRKHTKSREEQKVLREITLQELEAKMRTVNSAMENIQENIDNLETRVRIAEHKKKNELETMALTLKNIREEYCKNCNQCSGD